MSCTPIPWKIDCEVPERSTAFLSGTLVDEFGDAIPDDALDSFEGTLYDEKSGEILNEFEHVDLLTDPRCSVSAGVVALRLDDVDNAIINEVRAKEQHIVLLEWAWTPDDSIQRFGKAEVAFTVKNLAKVPAVEES